MQPVVFGINHTTAPLALRERLAVADDQLPQLLSALQAESGINEAVVLSTCNRTELCLVASDAMISALPAWLAQWRQLNMGQLQPALYCHQGEAAAQHLMRVACGLDSMVLGEPQILGQLKQAYSQAREQGSVGPLLERLLQQTFAAAKQVRSETSIGASAVSVAYAAVQLARQIFPALPPLKVLMVGAGDTSELVARHLYEQGVRQLTVVNRTLARGRELAERFGGHALPLTELPSALLQADVVICSTASPLPVVGVGAVERALKARKRQPMLLIDLAVPRDIEAEVADLDDAFLYTVDDLQTIVASNMAGRQQAAAQAEAMIQVRAGEFKRWLARRPLTGPIADYRNEAERLRDQAIQRALRQLDNGQEAAAVISELAHRLTNQLTHAPTKALHDTAASGDQQALEHLHNLLRPSSANTPGDAP